MMVVNPGVFNGCYRVMFINGNYIMFVSYGEMILLSEKGKLKLQSYLDCEEYVVRVLDCEVKSMSFEVVKVMIVVICIFLQ